jgi:hypothetical protein
VNGVLEAAVEVDLALRRANLRYCLIGGIALQRWGQPRTTLDVDAAVMTKFGSEEPVISQLISMFPARLSDAVAFAKESRVLLLKTSTGVGIDIALGAMPFESRMMDRSSIWQLHDQQSLRTCSAEDLIIQKSFAGRDQDWIDVRQIIERQTAARLNMALILDELRPLLELKEDSHSLERLQRIFLAE